MRPGKQLFKSVILLGLVGLMATVWPWALYGWLILLLVIVALVVVDFKRTEIKVYSVQRDVPNPLPLGIWSNVKLKIIYEGSSAAKLKVYDFYPSEVDVEGLPRSIEFQTRGVLKLEYRIRPHVRGNIYFGQTQLVIEGLVGFLDRSIKVGHDNETKVYPNFRAVSGYAVLAAENRLSQMGIIKKRRRGEGLNFHQLRPYRPGDSMRQIDWKATSRIKKLVSREYQEERDQQVVFLLDCGRRMLAKEGDLSHFDHTLNSLLLMTYVALKQGDSVGLMTFSGEKRWLSPRKGEHRFNEMMNTIYDLQPSSQGSDYSTATTELMVSLKKRSLVIILSNLRDEDADDVVPSIHLLKKNHLVVFASLQEVELNRVLDKEIHDFEDSLTVAATHHYLNKRRKAHEELNHRNVLTLDVEPMDLPVALVNKYLEIKSSQIL